MEEEDVGSVLTDEQLADLRQRLRDPGPMVSDRGVQTFFEHLLE
jgi:hypothetical protein